MKRVFFFSFCLLLLACSQNETIITKPDFGRSQVSYQTDANLDRIKSSIENKYELQRNQSGYWWLSYLDWSDVHLVANSDNSLLTYTIPIRKFDDQKLDYLIIKSRETGERAYLFSLKPDVEWATKNYSGDLSDFTGSVEVNSLDGELLISSTYTKGELISNQNNSVSRLVCEPWILIEWTEACVGDNCSVTEITVQEFDICPPDNSPGGGGDEVEELGDPLGGGVPKTSSDPLDKDRIPIDGSLDLCLEGFSESYCADMEKQRRLDALKDALAEDPYLLLDIDCDELKVKWLGLADHKPNSKVLERVEKLNKEGYDIEMQYLEDADGAVVNMDYFPVHIDKLPNNPATGDSFTGKEFFEYIRTNFADICFSNNSNFGAYNDVEMTKWEGSDYLGTVMRFDIKLREPYFGIQIGQQDGSVLCTDQQNQTWVFSTIYTKQDYSHPVSGNREFGLITNPDGTYTFYTSGVDRIAEWTDDMIGDIMEYSAFDGGEELWSSLQENLVSWINDPENEGKSEIIDSIIKRIDSTDLESFLNGEKSISELKCKN
ncbi:hypothetical protein [Marinigracilibium pacificum]|uniref:Uncharacterized protein n=1 Tax=Marinigracilibium pacificum TaxID=2729599 RepID=A0A848IR66_9BACT|nr:hypothetical protein [Marinigracilibium pacificum]NMM46847.1 hypothetical protein [Marinigracilibium pacificum]